MAGRAVHIGEPHLQQDLRLHRRHFHAQQVDGLAQRGGDRHHALGRDHVLHRAAHEGRVVLEGDIDIVVGKVARDLLPHRFQLRGAHADGQVVDQAGAVLLPDDQRGFAGRFAVDQHFLRVDRHGFGQVAVGHRDPLDVQRAVDDQRLADGDQRACRGRRRGLRLRRCCRRRLARRRPPACGRRSARPARSAASQEGRRPPAAESNALHEVVAPTCPPRCCRIWFRSSWCRR